MLAGFKQGMSLQPLSHSHTLTSYAKFKFGLNSCGQGGLSIKSYRKYYTRGLTRLNPRLNPESLCSDSVKCTEFELDMFTEEKQ